MKIEDIHFTSVQHVLDEIQEMNVKGGSAFGRAAAWAYMLACEQETFVSLSELKTRFDQISCELNRLKPTMATINNLKCLVNELLELIPHDTAIDEIKKRVIQLCSQTIEYSNNAVEKLGEYGGTLIKDGSTILMHSYSSALMSTFIKASNMGKKFTVICTESRPLRESRLAVNVLRSHNIPIIYITDSSVWEFLPCADIVIMGADTITFDGSVANKMGTALISQLAMSCKKPVYIASEVFKLDIRTQIGYQVVLERRTKNEIISDGDFESLDGIEIINQFFDLTPANQIRGLITEFGIIAPSSISSYWDSLKRTLINN